MLIVLIAFAVLMLIGMPVAFAIGISGTLFFIQHPELPTTIPIQVTVTETQNFALLAVPLFILAGNFLNNSGITTNLLKLATVLTGRMHGSLAQTSIALSTLMSGVTGSSIADAAMNARIIGLQMLKRGYARGYAAGVISYGSLLAPIIPPGIGFILYGTVGQVSIGRLFAAGIIPGLMLWAALAVAIAITARRRGYGPERETRATAREILLASWGGIWAILFPIMLLAGLRYGIFTPSEIGAFAVIYAVAVGFFAYRMLTFASFREAIEGSLVDVGAVMFLLALSAIFGYGIVFTRGDLGLDAGRDGQRTHCNGAHRALHPDRRHLHGRLGAHHHANAHLPSVGDEVRD
jgi:TRAP-type transport system large permease protein